MSVITVEASTAQATEGGELVFTFHRTGDLSGTQLVDYGFSGSATNEVDFTNVTGAVEFAANSATTELRFATFTDGLTEGSESVGVYLATNDGYTVGVPGTAEATLYDPPVVTVEASTAQATEGGELVFTFHRTGDLSGTQLVDYGFSGSATNEVDFTNVTGAVEFAANSATTELRFATFTDGLTEGSESVGVHLATNYGYTVGVPGTAEATLYDPPVIVSNGGGDTAALSIPENTTAVTTVVATDPDAGQPLTYAIAGGTDGALFNIDEDSGVLSFATAPDFENPADVGRNNIYDVTVQVSDENSGIDTQAIAVSVTNVTGISPPASNASTITGSEEEDVLTGLGGANTLHGLGGDDILGGGGGADTLNGGDGIDTLIGGAGSDIINGGAGNDTVSYLFGDGADAVDGGDGLDTLNIVGTAAANTLDIVYNGTALTKFEGGTVVNVEAITADLSGGVDTLTYAGTTANVTVDLSTGSASGFASIAGVENVTGGSENDTLTGDSLANILNGANGNDTFVADLNDGNDSLVGGAGVDAYDLSATLAGAIITTTSATSAEIGTDTLSSIENLVGGQGDDTITLGSGANFIDGQAGDDVLAGGAGADTLLGGAGSDTFNYAFGDGADAVDGGAEFDTLQIIGTAAANTLDIVYNGTALTKFEGGTVVNVEAITADLSGGVDTLTYAGTTANVTVDLSTGSASGFASIAGVENVTGGSGNDTLTGNGLVNRLAGGAGDDTYFADSADILSEAAAGGTDSVFTDTNSFTMSSNVENLTFIGVGDFSGTGNGSNNIITAGAGNDTLNGGGGADTLIGAAGDDIMNGNNGSDTFVFVAGFGSDTINGFDANPDGGQDFLNISAFAIAIAGFAARVTIADVGADTLVTIDGNSSQTIRLVGIGNATTVTQTDFVL